MSACPDKEALQGLLCGTLGPREIEVVRAHLTGCRLCQDTLDRETDDTVLRECRAALQTRGPANQRDPALERALALLESAFTDAAGASNGAPADASVALGPPTRAGDAGTLGAYCIEGELGRGGMGTVYRGFDPALKRTIAIKVLRSDLLHEQARARFVREAQVAARIRHDHVVAVHAVFDPPDGAPYLVMEYLDGPTLAEMIRRTVRLDSRTAARLIAHAADGLSAVHAAGVIHRDIKPGNIQLEQATGRAKIMDFGLARHTAAASGLTQVGFLAGTPAYMSPEQVRGIDALDSRTDVYSLGVTLYESLTGEVPFRGASHLVLQQVLATEPRPPRELNDAVPRDLETICLKALAKERSGRYETAREFADDLGHWERGEPISARRVGLIERGGRWCRRKPVVAGLCAALLVAVGGGLTGVFTQWRRAEDQWSRAESQRLLAVEEGDRAGREWKRAEQKAAEALANQGQAEKDFRRAREAVDKFLTEVAENSDLKAQNLEPLRRNLLETAREFYEQFVREHPSDPGVEAELGKAYGRLGQIAAILQSRAEAIEHYRKKQAIFERLHSERPDDLDCAGELADAWQRLGEAERYMHQLEAAEGDYQRARGLMLELTAADPHQPRFAHQLMETCYWLGDLYLLLRRYDDAGTAFVAGRDAYRDWTAAHTASKEHQGALGNLAYGQAKLAGAMQNRETQQGFFAEAIGQFERLAKTHPDADHYKSTLAGMLNEFGIMHARARQADQAEAAWRRVLEIHHELIRAHPANVFYQSLAADVGGNLGTLALFEQNRPEAALAALHESCAISERLVRNHPLIRYYAHNLRTTSANLELVCKHLGRLPEALETDDRVLSQLDEEFPAASRGKDVNQLYVNWLGRRAETLRRMERFDEALKDCDRALELVDEADRGAYLIWRRTIEAFVALRDRDFRRAAELAAVVATGPNNDAQRCAQVARIYAQAAALAGGGATSAVDRAVAGGGLADQYAASAFAQLRTAARLGAFQYGFEREALATDPAFSILKGRADFQKWLEELTPK